MFPKHKKPWFNQGNFLLVEMRGFEPLSKDGPIWNIYSLSCRINLSKLRSTSSLSLTDPQYFRELRWDNLNPLSYKVMLPDLTYISVSKPAFASLCRLLSESVICSVSRYLFVSLTYSYDCHSIQTHPCRIQVIPIHINIYSS